jgi:hypothetical protein
MNFLKRAEVLRIFGGIKCPCCLEELHIYEEGESDLTEDFREFISTSDNLQEGCYEFNIILNEKLRALAEQKITENEVHVWSRKYRYSSQ